MDAKRNVLSLFVSLIILFCNDQCNAQDGPIVSTKYGDVIGTAVPLASGRVINSFLGIPYAKPPYDGLRFQAPEEPGPWTEPFEALQPGNACYQSNTLSVNYTHDGWTRYDEDCLHVNIYAPQGASDMAVMVYIHGGAFQDGCNFGEPGYFMAEKDVVFVSVNYRLGILGFAYTGDGTIPGNMGLLDMVQALTFVQENIAAFGGDPNQVTISGHSAGGASVGFLMMTPLAEGLFQKAIPQSGNELHGWALLPPETNPEKYLVSVAEDFGCTTDSSQEMVDCLRTIDPNDLSQASFNCTLGHSCIGFAPVVDGIILPDTPMNLRQSGNYNKVPEMIGIAEDEYYAYLPFVLPGVDWEEGISRSEFDARLYAFISYYLLKYPDLDRRDDIYQAFRFYYADWPYFEDPIKNRDMFAKIFTDGDFGYGTDLQAKLHSSDGLDVFYYIYDYMASYTFLPEYMGTAHGGELTLQFGWPLFVDNQEAYVHSQANPLPPVENSTQLDKDMASFFITLWTNFAKFGNPTPEPVQSPNNEVLWPQFDGPAVELNYLLIQDTPSAQRDYRQQQYAFWTQYLDYLMSEVMAAE